MNNNHVHETFIVWLNKLLNVTVIKDRQSVERPALPYIMVDLANFDDLRERPSDFDYEETTNQNDAGFNEIMAKAIMETEWVFSVFSYGDNCDELLKKLKSAMHIRQVQEGLLPDLVIHEIGSVNSIPEFVDERWEPRAQCNVSIRGISSDGFVVDIIEEHTPFDIQTERGRT